MTLRARSVKRSNMSPPGLARPGVGWASAKLDSPREGAPCTLLSGRRLAVLNFEARRAGPIDPAIPTRAPPASAASKAGACRNGRFAASGAGADLLYARSVPEASLAEVRGVRGARGDPTKHPGVRGRTGAEVQQ